MAVNLYSVLPELKDRFASWFCGVITLAFLIAKTIRSCLHSSPSCPNQASVDTVTDMRHSELPPDSLDQGT